ncbi:Rap1-interacting factor 1 N terminal-domain-containing protein [Daldinia vernicosa]|uniref:Rap1-interacting factor 1 N terminal-domain-containing protein n=1 Tax=Daldinia vernicosa TaxID=114800 RepID=UPI002007B188|nr:Rap1-interacting factor 1 N terminal-domain-containing protein [Daldinia vernicosa]KAI0853499.1 Rap1-interacting factor 1 N terminal-domain-containing protein [Daldinia vernicosa]
MVSQIASVPRSLDSLPTRPPTPPRDKKQDTDSSSKLALSNHPVDTRLNLHTPPSYSSDPTNHTNTSSRRSTKKVGFLVQAEYQEAPAHADKENVRKQTTPASVPSSVASVRPIKSILKQTSSPSPLHSLDPLTVGDQVNIATMLDSTIKQLAGADRDSKIDAYMMLARALKTSNNLPDRIALQDKMSLFMQFIQRDVTTKAINENIDSSLVNHALTLLCTFFHFPAIASTLSSDFGVFIIDHCIRSFEDASVPKDVVRHLMRVVASQDFSAKVMTADRVGRLVASLHKIEEHLKGKSIIMSRILIYRRLVKQSRSHMITHSDWLLDLFTDMLSSMKEIRAAAIALGLEASFTIGKEKQLSRRVMEILQLQVDDTKYIEYYVERLTSMTKDKAQSASVPQVWSVVILLLRCPVDRWEFFGPWLEIIQRCFNSGDYHTKLEANYAWNRLVYALHLTETSFSKTIVTVCQPFISQLKRKGNSKQLEELRKVVIASVCNLYYYAFKPNLSTAQVDSYWDACVRPLIQQLAFPEVDTKQIEKPTAMASNNLTQAVLILTGLFNSSTSRLWKEDRVAENALVKPDELPALDPKWVRRNAARVFSVVEPILQKTFVDLASPESALCKLWRTLVSAVAAAASKEVKVSTDTATFMAHAFSVLARIWSQGLDGSDAQPEPQQKFLDATQAYFGTIIEYLGQLPFTEKLLSLNKQNSFIPVATPSHRSGRGQGLTRTPLHHLFSILSTLPPGIPDDDGLLSLIRVVLDPFIISRSSSHGKTELARELIQTLPMDVLSPYGPWVFISDILSLSLESSQSSHLTASSGSEPMTIGHEYREIIRHLERGLKSTPNLPWEHWDSLFQLLTTRVFSEAGSAGLAIMVVEPLAKHFLDLDLYPQPGDEAMSPTHFKAGINLISNAAHPKDRQALDAARRRLWGTSIAGSRPASFDPFDKFYRLANHLLETSYLHIEHYNPDEMIVKLLTEIGCFLKRCNRSLLFKSIAHLQHGIGLWIQDENAQYSIVESTTVAQAVETLWDQICKMFLDTDTRENLQLDAIEELLCLAFQSKHRGIVNYTAVMWNRVFEHAEEIQYPEKLKNVLISIHSYVDVVLPGVDVSSYASNGQEPSFIESQDNLETANPPLDKQDHLKTPLAKQSSSRRSVTPGSVQLSLPSKQGLATTPNQSRPRSARRSATPKLRHDDSQIQFAPIESSPSRDAMESQFLTDRQKEIRERQRENAVIFAHIRASTENQISNEVKDLKQERDTTPQRNQGLEDYVTSTPTPRRGQAPMIDFDHEMTDDIPSSPPEPRRNLLAEMKPRTRSSNMLQDFPILSSPVSGSPVTKRQTVPADESHSEREDAGNGEDVSGIVEESPDQAVGSQPERISTNVKNKSAQVNAPKRPTTPRKTRSGKILDASPKSDPEVFVDALTSPTSRSPRALRSNMSKGVQTVQNLLSSSQSKDRSFELSDDEERSLARLVIELDSRKCEPAPKDDSESPEKPRELGIQSSECITVSAGSNKSRGKSKSKKDESNQLPPVIPSSSTETGSSHSPSKRSKRKRKRHTDRSSEPGSSQKKRRQHNDADVESVSNSQVPENIEGETTEINTEVDTSMELDTNIAFSSQDLARQEPIVAEAADAGQRSSSPVDFNDSLVERESDTEAVTLQIITEASQQSEVESIPMEVLEDGIPLIDDTEMVDQEEGDAEEAAAEVQAEQPRLVEETAVEKSAADKIMDALREGLEGLRTATLTRDEVNKIEDMFFDIKKELYQAESRGRC